MVASIFSTFIPIIAINRSVDTTGRWAATILCTGVIIFTAYRGGFTSGVGFTCIFSARIFIVTMDFRIAAARLWVAII
jgi:hypothetical protein